MEDIRLISPSIEYAEDILQFRAELLEAKDADSSANLHKLFMLTYVEIVKGNI